MKEIYKKHRFNAANTKMITLCNSIIDKYLKQGLRLTLRQLYYQLVSMAIIKNKEREYKNLSTLISNARLAGLIDWEAIEDRIRTPFKSNEFQDINDLINTATAVYRLPRWKGQDTYAELWVEKDALAGVLRPLAQEYHVTLMVNRGYSSQSAMYESAQRIINSVDTYDCDEHNTVIFYLGDLDPSGEDMVRDIQNRLQMFEANVEVKKVALTIEQVNHFNPPPNPTRLSDPRASDFLKKYGESSWEVDALPPEELTRIIREQFERVIDREEMNKIVSKEKKDIKQLKDLLSKKGK